MPCAGNASRGPFQGYANVVDVASENDGSTMRFLVCYSSHSRNIRLVFVIIDHEPNNVTIGFSLQVNVDPAGMPLKLYIGTRSWLRFH